MSWTGLIPDNHCRTCYRRLCCRWPRSDGCDRTRVLSACECKRYPTRAAQRAISPARILEQEGIQYCMADDLFDCDAFLNDVRIASELQGVPLTTLHGEFSPGQWEINTLHQEDAIVRWNSCALAQAYRERRRQKARLRRHVSWPNLLLNWPAAACTSMPVSMTQHGETYSSPTPSLWTPQADAAAQARRWRLWASYWTNQCSALRPTQTHIVALKRVH